MDLCYTFEIQKSAGLMNQAPTEDEQYIYKKGGFDESNPYKK